MIDEIIIVPTYLPRIINIINDDYLLNTSIKDLYLTLSNFLIML